MLIDVRQKIRQKFKQGPKMSNFRDSKLELGGGGCALGTYWIRT